MRFQQLWQRVRVAGVAKPQVEHCLYSIWGDSFTVLVTSGGYHPMMVLEGQQAPRLAFSAMTL